MSRKQKGKNPRLVVRKGIIRGLKDHLPQTRRRPLCSECLKPTRLVSLDHGKARPEKFGRGRPPKNRPGPRPRFERIGYWCEQDGLWFYLNGTTDFRDRPTTEGE